MVHSRLRFGIRWVDRNASALWVVAICLFGIYDVAIVLAGIPAAELLGIRHTGVTIASRYNAVPLVTAKVLVFGVCYGLWRVAPQPHANGVPLGLALLGLLTAVWDTVLLARAIELHGLLVNVERVSPFDGTLALRDVEDFREIRQVMSPTT